MYSSVCRGVARISVRKGAQVERQRRDNNRGAFGEGEVLGAWGGVSSSPLGWRLEEGEAGRGLYDLAACFTQIGSTCVIEFLAIVLAFWEL